MKNSSDKVKELEATVERLQHEYQVLSDNTEGLRESKSVLYKEVERLTRQLAEHRKHIENPNLQAVLDERNLLQRENAKLREALTHVAKLCRTAAVQHNCFMCKGHAEIAEAAMRENAERRTD